MDTNRTCNRCGNAVVLELNKDIDYLYYCPACDENMYTFETKEQEVTV